MKKKKLPVVFAGLSPFMNNKILQRSFMSKFPGGESGSVWAERVIAAGYEFMTIDRYYKKCAKSKALLISDMAVGIDSSSGLIPTFCMSLESPIVASRYYHHIASKTSSFHKVWDWAGVISRIHGSDHRFITNAWPTTDKISKNLVPWNNRRFLTMISANKRALQWQNQKISLSAPYQWVRNIITNINTTYIKAVDPWMKSELYSERLQAISHFSRYDDFDLYGNGWDVLCTPLERQFGKHLAQSWRGVLYGAKSKILSNYRFYLCFENTIFPGYLTEKIFDCFFNGVIPIYLGDPDIHIRVPPASFIDARKFNSYAELDDYLHSVSSAGAQIYLDAARQFLQSDAFRVFTADSLADSIVITLDKVNSYY